MRAFVRRLPFVFAVAAATAFAPAHAEKDAVSLESDRLWEAFENDDLDAFDEVLDRGVLDTQAFERHESHYIFCEATRPGREAFLESILAHGVSPDVRNMGGTVSDLDRNALACASTRWNIEAFDILLEADADTTVNLCDPCEEPQTIFMLAANTPPFSSRILERRRLTSHEAQYLAWQVEHISLANSHNGQPTWRWYQDLLREEYGIDGLQPLSAQDWE